MAKANFFVIVDNDYSEPRDFEHFTEAMQWFGREVSAEDVELNIKNFVTGELVEVNNKSYQLFNKDSFEEALDEDNE